MAGSEERADQTVRLEAVTQISGFAFGLRQGSLLARVALDPDLPEDLGARLWQVMEAFVPVPPRREPDGETSADRLIIGDLADATRAVLSGAGYPVQRRYVCRTVNRDGRRAWQLVLPVHAHRIGEAALRWCVEAASALARDADPPNGLDALLDQISGFAPQGSNSRNLVEAALELDLPVIPLPGDTYQFGWGRKARRFFSSSSDDTGTIAMNLSRRKDWTNRILALAGLPVPRQAAVRSEDQAAEVAGIFGYPVVVKAIDLDQGAGVEPGLKDEPSVRAAYARISRASDMIAVESFIEGQDHRLNVIGGKVVGAVLRVPAGVTGDGSATIAELVERVNQDPRRSIRQYSTMKPIVLDNEALALLADADLSPDSVPEAGRFVRLKRTANVTSGGHTAPILDRVHPDNIALCEEAVRLIGLDIAGVDLLVPDIARSWRETGGGICEINGRPQIGLTYPDVFREMLAAYVQDGGRIPVGLLVTGRPSGFEIGPPVPGLGVSTSEAQRIGREVIGLPRSGLVQGTRALLLRREVKAAIAQATPEELQRDASPFDRCDVLGVADDVPGDALARLLAVLAPSVDGPVFAVAGSDAFDTLGRVLGRHRVRAVPEARVLWRAMTGELGISKAGFS